MNKKIILAIIVFFVLAVTAFGLYWVNKKQSASKLNSSETAQTSMQPTTKVLSVAELFQKAMSSGSLKCTFSSDTVTGTTYIKNGNVSFSATDASTKKVMHSIIKNKTMWSWSDGEKNGMMIDMSKLESNVTPPQGATSTEDIQKQIEANRPECNEESIPDSIFDVPSNVTFTDLSKMMKSIPKVSLPEGFKIPSDIPTN